MVRLGETAKGAAHEMNNPLTVITGNAQLLASRLTAPKDQAAAQTIADAAADLTSLITSLHLLSQLPPNHPKSFDLKESLEAAATQARSRVQAPAQVAIKFDRPRGVYLDPELFAGIMVELVTNALQACPNGTVTISSRAAGPDEPLAIVVQDQGQGMSDKALRHAFDPFFSDRPAGRGRGLGLTRARRLAEAMHAEISLESQQGKGATATLLIRNWNA